MFTDSEATPARVEMLLEVVRSMSGRKLDGPTVRQLLQPEGLPGLTSNSEQARSIMFAARELELIAEQPDGNLRPTRSRDDRSACLALVEAIDDKVLRDDKVEPWFALFYAFLLGRDESAASGSKAGIYWEAQFERELFSATKPANRFNPEKYRGLRRWFRYVGLGWHDGDDRFHPNPYERIARMLPTIFGKNRDLAIEAFIDNLSEICPELDGGQIFLRANPRWDRSRRTTSLGLSHALVDLHLDRVIELNCPLDGDGWSIAKASPPFDRDHLKSDRITNVRYPVPGASANG
jgi:hypothetical protein